MVSATTPTHTAGYEYDPFGKRLSKTVDDAVTYYLYDNEDIIVEYDSAGSLIASYIHGQGIDEPISMSRDGSTYYYTFDGLGSVVELTDGVENMAESYKYDAFGNLETPPATGNPYTYTAREYDSESGLYFYRARYYSPSVGRFLTEDPIGTKSKENLYVYVLNNPINFTDPTGERVQSCGKGKHGYIRIVKNPTYNSAYGFYPKNHTDPEVQLKVALGLWVPAEVLKDSGGSCRDVTKDKSKDRCVYQEMQWFRPREYNLYYFNCFDWRQHIYRRCGI